MTATKTVKLYGYSSIGILIPMPSAVRYQSQVGGYSCKQETVEGAFLPWGDVWHIQDSLDEHFLGPKWKGCCTGPIDEEDATVVESILWRCPVFDHKLLVDRSRINESMEAWIAVDYLGPEDLPFLDGFGPFRGYLTWPNSD